MTSDPWSIPRLQATVDLFLGVGSDADLPQPVRFVRSVAALIRRRLATDTEPDGFAYFLLHPPATAASVSDREQTRVTMLDLGRDRVTGRLWLINCVANDGLAIEIAATENHTQVVELITNDLALGATPTLMFDMATAPPTGRYFPNGLADLESVTTVVFESGVVTWERVRESVDGVYRSSLITPEVQGRAETLWTKAEKYWSASDAEYKVQAVVKAGLAGAFPYCDIRSEQPQAEGRHDLLIEEYGETGAGARAVIPHAMIELKVLRSRDTKGASVSDNATSQWAVSGVKQAHSYGTGRHSKLLLTFLFDARYPTASADCLAAAYKLAEQLSVRIGRWQLYGKPSDLRDAIAESTVNE